VDGTSTPPGRDGSFSVRLAPQPTSVAAARRHVRALLEDTGREDLVESAVLVVSELATNALLHAGSDIDLAGTVDSSGLRVEVGDGSSHLPSRRRYAATSGTGRGLLMLESIVDDWGVTQHAGGKTVWFHLSAVGNELESPVSPRTIDTAPSSSPGESVPVELQNMPLLLHAAWQEHAEALLREYLLASLDDDGPDSIQMHADAIDAIAVLEEHVPPAPIALENDLVLNEAVEPHVSAERIELPVPRESVAHFETLDRAIEAALDLSREGLVLAAPTQPELQTFRRWMCRQVLRQAAGGTPEPWSVPAGNPRRELVVPPEWDPATVTGAQGGVIAADERSHILAVSPAAAEILGYDDPEDLVGTGLTTIIPERYRQAHLAGFTMYLLVGRKPLLDRPVQVPALRADGVEVDVVLLIRHHAVGDGHSVLLADISRQA
jgi:PAS domain S-box-containing protein